MSECDPAPRRKSRRAQRLATHTRACLLWGAGFFIAAHLALLIGTQGRWPQLRDPEFGYKLNSLRQQTEAEPDRPLLVCLGSSRTGQGMRLGVIPEMTTPKGPPLLTYNFSQVGSGPLGELVCLRRLLDAGIRPNWLAIEVLPPLLGRNSDAVGDSKVGASRLTWNDVCLLRHYVAQPLALVHHWFQGQLAPWHAHRFSIMNHYASNWLPWRLRLDHWKALDARGWSDLGLDTEIPVKNPAAFEVARNTYVEELKHFAIAPMQDRALRDLLALCRQEGIPTVLYLMPEGRLFQSWYVPATRACIDRYLTCLSEECHVPIVDARNWMPDDLFLDSHHLDRRGATHFARRFGKEVIPPLVQGRFDRLPSLLAPIHTTYPEEEREAAPRIEAKGRSGHVPAPTLSIKAGALPGTANK
jgi:hypothetical protein